MQENNKLAKLFSQQRNKKIALVKSTIKKCKSQFKLLDGNHPRPKYRLDLKPNEGDQEDDTFKLSSQGSLYGNKCSFDDMKEMKSIESKESINSKKQDEDMLFDCTEDFRKSVDVDLKIEEEELKSMQDEMRKLLSSNDKHIVDADEKDGNEDIIYEFKRTTALGNLYHVTKKQVAHIEPTTNKNQTGKSETMNSDKVTEIKNEEDFSDGSETFSDDDEAAKASSMTGNEKKEEKKKGCSSIKSLMLWLIIVIIGYLFLKEN